MEGRLGCIVFWTTIDELFKEKDGVEDYEFAREWSSGLLRMEENSI